MRARERGSSLQAFHVHLGSQPTPEMIIDFFSPDVITVRRSNYQSKNMDLEFIKLSGIGREELEGVEEEERGERERGEEGKGGERKGGEGTERGRRRKRKRRSL